MKILFVSPRFPFPPVKGDQAVAYHRMRTLSARHEVQLLCLYENDAQLQQIGELERVCSRVWPVKLGRPRSVLNLFGAALSDLPGQVLYYGSRELNDAVRHILDTQGIDVVHAVTLRVAPAVAGVPTPVVFDLVDSMQLNLATRREKARGIKRFLIDLERGRIEQFERDLAARHPSIVVSAIDKATIGNGSIHVLPLGVDAAQFYPMPAKRSAVPTVVFTGNLAYGPNVTAAIWFAEQCLPQVQALEPAARFVIAGKTPVRAIRALAKRKGVEIQANVASMGEAINQAWVAVTPMQSGSGMQFKTLEAMACGVPVITTTHGLGDIRATADVQIVVRDGARQFATATAELLRDRARAAELGRRGAEFVAQHHSWQATTERLEGIYREAIAGGKDQPAVQSAFHRRAAAGAAEPTTVLQHAKAFDTVDGGVEHVVRELIGGLNADPGFRCDVLCQGDASPRAPGAKYEVLRSPTTLTLASAGLSWNDLATWRSRRRQYAIVHVHSPWPQSNFNALLAPVKGALVVHWHSDIVRKHALYAAFKPFETALLRRADRICVTSEKLMQESAVLGPYRAKCEVIPIGIGDATPAVSEADAAAVRAVTQGRRLVFALGRLVAYKGFGFLVEAAKHLADDHVVVIGGRGPLRDELQALIDERGLGGKVKLVGHITNGEAQAYLDACESFCLPSAHNAEAFGIVQLEAMRSGKPVISTQLHGSGVDWVNQHMVTGLVVPPGDAGALADAIKTMGAGPLRQQLGQSARARYQALFTADKMVAATARMYRSLL